MNKDLLYGRGKIVYDPFRPNIKKEKNVWWCVVEIDDEIANYYRWWVSRRYHKTMLKPSWNAHITVVGGTKPKNINKWKERHGQEVIFAYEHYPQTYDPNVRRSSEPPHWWVRVYCDELNDVREELGLRREYPFHITVGKEKY